jgi:hypothetical protein
MPSVIQPHVERRPSMRKAVGIVAIIALVIQGLGLALELPTIISSINALSQMPGGIGCQSCAELVGGDLFGSRTFLLLLSLPTGITLAVLAGSLKWTGVMILLILTEICAVLLPLVWLLLIYNGDNPTPVPYAELKLLFGYLGALLLGSLPSVVSLGSLHVTRSAAAAGSAVTLPRRQKTTTE